MPTSIEHLASQYPHFTAAFANIPQGAAHLRRIQDLNATWQNMLLSGTTRQYTQVVVTADRVPVPTVDTFDITYAGGGLNLLHAAVMTQRYGSRVLVFDRFTVGAVHLPEVLPFDVLDDDGQKHSYAAQLLIDGMGSTSPIACQLNCGRPFSLVCPTVGTVARGYKQGETAGAIDPAIGEILVTTED